MNKRQRTKRTRREETKDETCQLDFRQGNQCRSELTKVSKEECLLGIRRPFTVGDTRLGDSEPEPFVPSAELFVSSLVFDLFSPDLVQRISIVIIPSKKQIVCVRRRSCRKGFLAKHRANARSCYLGEKRGGGEGV